jgi:alpha,alpha-trehalase
MMSAISHAKLCLKDSLRFFESSLFHDVQMAGIFADSKTFADASPKHSWSEIYADYQTTSVLQGFDLESFVYQYFVIPKTILLTNDTNKTSVKTYIESLWPQLEKQPDKQTLSSLLPLAHPYVVPGGRFREIYYWDSYFTALGLNESGREDLVQSMILNFIDLQEHLGCIPNGNRTYYNTRSQPPVLGLMVEMFFADVDACDSQAKTEFFGLCVQGMQKEYEFWMQGSDQLTADIAASKRVVKMPNGTYLNRYWDDSAQPRAESYREDIEAAENIPVSKRSDFYRNIRAACESGWDFSSRWLSDPNDLSTIQTTNIIPVDLNCLLYKLEDLLSQFYLRLQNRHMSNKYAEKARIRSDAIDLYLWNDKTCFYHDYDRCLQKQCSTESLAACLPLFVNIASAEQAQHVSQKLADFFLVDGGLLTTLNDSPQQWDAPNGWAPLHWFAVIGLHNYQLNALAKEIMKKWLGTVEQQFSMDSNILEKYNVKNSKQLAKGGEYELQHGFGWTNGVSLAFYKQLGNRQLGLIDS